MDQPISELNELLATMSPVHNPGCYVVTSTSDPVSLTLLDVVSSIQEPEGVSLIVCEQRAHELGLPILLRCAWITLTVHSDLQSVGLAASFAHALADWAHATRIAQTSLPARRLGHKECQGAKFRG